MMQKGVGGADGEEEKNLVPLSEKFTLECIKNSSVKISHKWTMGDLDTQTFYVRFDPTDKYLAQCALDGTIRIYNMFTGKTSFILNTDMEQQMPMVSIKWRPLNCPAVTKNVIISVNANGSLQHWHVTSGKLLNTIFDEFNQLLTVDYNKDGTQFVAAGNDTIVRVYDEKVLKQSRTLQHSMEGVPGAPGHNNRIFCCKFDAEDPNLIVSGGWDKTVMIWDIRAPTGPVRTIFEPFICGDAIDLHDGYLLTGSHKATKQLQLWDFGTAELIENIDWDEGLPSEKPCMVYQTQFQKNSGDLIIAGGAGSNEVKIFDGEQMFKPCAQIKNLSRACFSVDFSNSGDMFACGGGDGVIRVFNVIQEI